ncbi:MAG TPA: acetyl-CoA acetyltransferase [Acidimicrobiales bacterium]|nr:acetyl-CoA acetyltransferase [Acidimicrobiales bacterium]
MPLDPRTPVIVGVAQALRRPTEGDLDAVAEPADWMAEVLLAAAEDAGTGPALLRAAGSVRTVELFSWRYPNPGLAVAERIGASPAETVSTTTGGNHPQLLLTDAGAAVQRGELDVVLLAGAEAVHTRVLAQKAKAHLRWSVQPEDVAPPRMMGGDRPGNSPFEQARGVLLPMQVYPMFENALRAAAGRSIEEHGRRVAALWARFSEVAARNPYAWAPTARSPEEIAAVTPDNRMIAFPYRKLMNSNIRTDQAAAVILCSVEAARRFGVPEDRWVFPLAGADSHDTWFVSERRDFVSAPGLRAAFEALRPEVVDHVDLYSCFPSAVEIAAAELGLGLDRQLTVTGGLTFAGGPGNDYVLHSIASTVEVLRRDPGSVGLVTGVGWYLTKHSLGLYSTTPPVDGFRASAPEPPEVVREPAPDYEGPCTVETYTITYSRDGRPEQGLFALLTPDGRRTWGSAPEPDPTEEWCGRPARLSSEGRVSVS